MRISFAKVNDNIVTRAFSTFFDLFTGGDSSLLASLIQSSGKSPTRSAQVQPVAIAQPSLDQLRAWEEEKEALRR